MTSPVKISRTGNEKWIGSEKRMLLPVWAATMIPEVLPPPPIQINKAGSVKEMFLPAFIGKKIADVFSKGVASANRKYNTLIDDVRKTISKNGDPDSPPEATIREPQTEALDKLIKYGSKQLTKLIMEHGSDERKYEMKIAKLNNYINAIIKLCNNTKSATNPSSLIRAQWKGIDHNRLEGILKGYSVDSSSTSALSLQEPNDSKKERSSIDKFVRKEICPTLEYLLKRENRVGLDGIGMKQVKELTLNLRLEELENKLNESGIEATSTTELKEVLCRIRNQIFMLRPDCEPKDLLDNFPSDAQMDESTTTAENQSETDDASSLIRRLAERFSNAASSVKAFVLGNTDRSHVHEDTATYIDYPHVDVDLSLFPGESEDVRTKLIKAVDKFEEAWTLPKIQSVIQDSDNPAPPPANDATSDTRAEFDGNADSVHPGYYDPAQKEFDWLRELVSEKVLPIVQEFKSKAVEMTMDTENLICQYLNGLHLELCYLSFITACKANKLCELRKLKQEHQHQCNGEMKETCKKNSTKELRELMEKIKSLGELGGADDATAVEDLSTSDCSQFDITNNVDNQDVNSIHTDKIEADDPHVHNDFEPLTFAPVVGVTSLIDSIYTARKEPLAANQDDAKIPLIINLIEEVISPNNEEIDPAAAEKPPPPNQRYNTFVTNLIEDFIIKWTPDKQRRQYKSLFTGDVKPGYDDPNEDDFNWLREFVKEDVFPIVKRFKNAKLKRRELTDNEFSKKLKEVDATLCHLAMVSGWETNDSCKSIDKSRKRELGTEKAKDITRYRPHLSEGMKEKRKKRSTEKLKEVLKNIKSLGELLDGENSSTSVPPLNNTDNMEDRGDNSTSNKIHPDDNDDEFLVTTTNAYEVIYRNGRIYPAAAEEPPANQEVIVRTKVNEEANAFWEKWTQPRKQLEGESNPSDAQTVEDSANSSDNSVLPLFTDAAETSGTGAGVDGDTHSSSVHSGYYDLARKDFDWLRKYVSETILPIVQEVAETEFKGTKLEQDQFCECLAQVDTELCELSYLTEDDKEAKEDLEKSIDRLMDKINLLLTI